LREYDISTLNVLLVEKHAYMRRMFRDILRQYNIREVRDCDKVINALSIFKEGSFDLVITDWSPGLDGIKFLQTIRQEDGSDRFVPVIVVTANTEAKHIYKALDSGMTEFLAKPISATKLYSRICSVIERRRMYISNNEFFGPDRRRVRKADYSEENRRIGGNANGPERRDHSSTDFVGQNRRN